MKKLIFTPIFFLLFFGHLISQIECGTDHIHQHRLITDPEYKRQMEMTESEILNIIQNRKKNGLRSDEIYSIPIVVHVIHLGEPVGSGTNISDDQIYRAINGVNDRWRNIVGDGIDMQIEFCLSARDPNNQLTNGINRRDGRQVAGYQLNGIQGSNTCGADHINVRNLSRWPATDYYNIWVVNKICGGSYGYANYTPPQPYDYDGSIVIYNSMEYSLNPTPQENYLQTTLAHELGHGLNLRHTFEGSEIQGSTIEVCPKNNDCLSEGDFVCDTPPHRKSDCVNNICSNSGNWQNSNSNYMSYCINHTRFTSGQKVRALASLEIKSRKLLLSSLGCKPPLENDAVVNDILFPFKTNYLYDCEKLDSIAPIVSLKNLGQNNLTSVTIQYKISNDTTYKYLWNGNLLPNKEIEVTLPKIGISSSGEYVLNVNSILPNGQMDGVLPDNTIQQSFKVVFNNPLFVPYNSVTESCNGLKNGSLEFSPTYRNIIVEDFEVESGWTVVNGVEPNKWVIGKATASTGEKSIYISTDSTSNVFNTNSSSIVHFYKDFYFPPNAKNITIKFDWKNAHKPINNIIYDFLTLNILPINKSGSDVISSKRIQSNTNFYFLNNGNFTSATISGVDSIAGKTKRIVFSWENDNFNGIQPPGAIDNIVISYDLQFNSQFQYSWKDFPELNTKELNDLPGGTYKVTVLDNLGCIKTLDAIIGSPDSIDIEIVKKDLNCIDVNSGEISLIPLNGVEPIKYLWSNSAITNKIENIISGLYKVTVSDSRNPTSTKPISPSCTPQTNDPRFKIGVYSVQLKNINNSNTIVPTNYRDYTNFFTFLAPNDIHELKIITGPDYPEKVLAWIDYNNNGIFDAEEMIMNSSNTIPNRIHINKFKIPENAIKHIPLRMRVGSDISSGLNTFNSSCAPSTFGHIEDYTVFIGLPACEVKEIEILPYSSEKPVIQLVNNNSCLSSDVQLTTDVDGKFLWNTGDTTRIIHIINSGIYSVTVTDNDNCSSASDPFDVILYSPGESIPPPVIITDSRCDNCVKTNGVIGQPDYLCPFGYTLQYSQNNGQSWSFELPTYNELEAITILTRCGCFYDSNVGGLPGIPFSTAPELCDISCDCGVRNLADETAPTVIINNNSCIFGCIPTEGLISRGGGLCPGSTKLQFKVDNGEWTDTLPRYNKEMAQTIITRCACEEGEAKVYSQTSTPKTTNPAKCPCDCGVRNLADETAPTVIINNNSCIFGCIPTEGLISRGGGLCPGSTKLQFKVDNGEWTDTLPRYNKEMAQTIITRCACEEGEAKVYSQTSTPKTTNPAKCPCDCGVRNLADETAPTVIINNNSCIFGCIPTEGLISRGGGLCPGSTKLQFKVDNGEWTDTLPRYNKEMAQTIITRCACEEGEAKVYSQTSTPKTTNPAKCPCDCGVRNLADETAPTVIINNNSCIFGCIPTEGLISRGGGLCPGSTKLQFKVDNGEWTDTLPRYNKEMAQTIITRCACEEGEAKVYSQTSTPKTTNPAKCPCDCGVRNLADETAPTVIINNNSCIFGCIPTEGLISRGGGLCQGSTKLQFKVDNGEWTDTLPRYNKEMAQTIITRCACEEGEAKVYSQTSTPKTTNPAKCPCDCGVRNLADETAPTVIINNNSCIFGCIPTEGLISRGGGLCPGSTKLQFKVDNGEWTDTLPRYNKEMAQTIITRCACEEGEAKVYSQTSTPKTTNPAKCPCDCGVRNLADETAPTVIINNNSCIFGCIPTEGLISRGGGLCPGSTKLQFKVDNGEWTDTLPRYNKEMAQTIITRCACEEGEAKVYSQTSTPKTTNPAKCPCDCGVRNLADETAPTVIINNNSCIFGCIPTDGLIARSGVLCPGSTVLQFKVNNGDWTETLPRYSKDSVMTIITRCACEGGDVNVYSKPSAPKTTKPAQCHPSCYCPDLNLIPSKVVVINSYCNYPYCQPLGGTIIMPNNNCPTGSTMQYSTDNGLNWTSTIPQYFQSGAPQSIITRCNCNSYKPMSSISSSPVVTSPSSCPANCPCVTPSLQASLILFYNVSTNQFTINWSNGNGSRRVVKINTLNQFTAPANGTDPTANPMFAGFGEQVVYNGSGNSVTVTGLKPNTVYWVRVYEANCEGIYSLYNTTVATQNPNSQQTVLVPPHIQSFTASTVMPLPGGGTQREIFYHNTNVYGVNAPITIAADGSTNTIFTLKASFITGMGFRIVNKQGKIVTNGDLAFDPVRYGRLGVKQVLSHNTLEMTYTHPQLVDDAVLPLRIQLLYHDGLLGLTIPLQLVAASPLPVQISSLNAYHDQKNNLNEISWTTQSERNNDQFVLLRKIENENMIPVAEIQGAGNSDAPLDYIYLDIDLHRNGIYYYQLEQVDFDGKKMYSDIVQVSVHKSSNVTTSIYPNPTNGIIYCKIDGKFDNLQIQIFDLLGNKMGESESSDIESPESNPFLSCEHLSGGVYQIVIWVDGVAFNHKVVLIK